MAYWAEPTGHLWHGLCTWSEAETTAYDHDERHNDHLLPLTAEWSNDLPFSTASCTTMRIALMLTIVHTYYEHTDALYIPFFLLFCILKFGFRSNNLERKI